MTKELSGEIVADHINSAIAGAAVGYNRTDVWVKPELILDVAVLMKESSELDCSFLTSVSAVDYVEYFEIVYHLLSMRKNASVVIKSKCPGRGRPTIPSVTTVWKGADLQEREVWDLMGIHFAGHPNLKRILLWEGFPGHPLRKDHLG